MEVSDYGGVRSNPTPPSMKGELLMYVCSKCFISAFGQEIYMTMMQSGENVLCPECAKKKYKKENEK